MLIMILQVNKIGMIERYLKQAQISNSSMNIHIIVTTKSKRIDIKVTKLVLRKQAQNSNIQI